MARTAQPQNQLLLNWLADIYWDVPDKQLLDRFANIALFSFEPELDKLITAIGDVIGKADASVLRDIAISFTSLFCAAKVGAPYPYESVFLGKQKLLLGEASAEVKRLYEQSGYAYSAAASRQNSNEPADHISFELGYIAYLLDEGLPEQAIQFSNEHLLAWVPDFASTVCKSDTTGFYSLVAQTTVAMLLHKSIERRTL
jgi:TorA maturation chaperone TorD